MQTPGGSYIIYTHTDTHSTQLNLTRSFFLASHVACLLATFSRCRRHRWCHLELYLVQHQTQLCSGTHTHFLHKLPCVSAYSYYIKAYQLYFYLYFVVINIVRIIYGCKSVLFCFNRSSSSNKHKIRRKTELQYNNNN